MYCEIKKIKIMYKSIIGMYLVLVYQLFAVSVLIVPYDGDGDGGDELQIERVKIRVVPMGESETKCEEVFLCQF